MLSAKFVKKKKKKRHESKLSPQVKKKGENTEDNFASS